MSLLNEVQFIPTHWREVILTFANNYEKEWNILEKMYAEETTIYDGEIEIYPLRENIFRCFHYFDPKETKVVLMGQDPYHGPNQATGLCFSVPEGEKIPPSLRNIKKELQTDLGKTLSSQNLEHWAKQGVLMLNASLTVRQGNASSHMKYWLPLTKYLMQYLSDNVENISYLVWGAFAHRQVEDIVDWEKNQLVISSHPSPLSANKKYKTYPAFIGSRPFSQIKKEIDW
jgi:uracil-DNA glycosylase